jgi:hypothetical protein
MRLAYLAAFAASVIALNAVAVASAEAQQRKRYVNPRGTERITTIDENGRVRTRITVQPRSFLDGGTEVIPGDRKFVDYAMPPTYMPNRAWDPALTWRGPLPRPFELPGFSPWSFY